MIANTTISDKKHHEPKQKMTPPPSPQASTRKDEQRYLELARKIILSHLEDVDCQVFLYGSRACGQASGRSDIDVGFLCKQPLDEQKLAEIRHSLEESIVPYPVDLTDFTSVEDASFKQQALKEAIRWK